MQRPIGQLIPEKAQYTKGNRKNSNKSKKDASKAVKKAKNQLKKAQKQKKNAHRFAEMIPEVMDVDSGQGSTDRLANRTLFS